MGKWSMLRSLDLLVSDTPHSLGAQVPLAPPLGLPFADQLLLYLASPA